MLRSHGRIVIWGLSVRRATGMLSRMKESYRKGIANHPGPDHVRAVGNPALEALDKGTCRLGIPEVDELRNRQNQMRRRCQANRKATL